MTSIDQNWFADDALWEAISPMLASEDVRAAAVPEVEAICSLAAMPSGRVLDLCCGAGRHSVEFARRAFDVTGVDRSAFLLEHAREYASAEDVSVRWVEADMRDFVEPGAFDLAVCLFTSFGYFEDSAENDRVLGNVFASLAPGGVFVLDVVGKETVARIFQPCRARDLPNGATVVMRARVVDDWSRIENEWSVLMKETVRTFRFRHWVYSGMELRALLQHAGFGRVEIFGGLDGSPYDTDATRLVVRGWKPAVAPAARV